MAIFGSKPVVEIDPVSEGHAIADDALSLFTRALGRLEESDEILAKAADAERAEIVRRNERLMSVSKRRERNAVVKSRLREILGEDA